MDSQLSTRVNREERMQYDILNCRQPDQEGGLLRTELMSFFGVIKSIRCSNQLCKLGLQSYAFVPLESSVVCLLYG